MKCEEFLLKIDAYIDGELSNEEINAMRAHAEGCEACRAEMDAAELLRDTLRDFDEHIEVPLEAQAAWRRAVRSEAKAKNTRKWARAVYAVAAALVLVLGCTLAMNNDIFAAKRVDAAPENAAVMRAAMGDLLIAADGAETSAKSGAEAVSAFKKYSVKAFADADKLISGLAAEYGASDIAKVESGSSVTYRIELPMDYQADFLSAMTVLGEELNSEIYESDSDTAIVRIEIGEA